MFETGPFTMLGCTDCHFQFGLRPEEVVSAQNDLRAFLGSTWRCPQCGREWSIQEAIINGWVTSIPLVSTIALGGIFLYGTTTIAVGIESIVELPQEVPLILFVDLTPQGNDARLSWIPVGKDKFIIVSSTTTTMGGQNPAIYAKLGERLEIDWSLVGRPNWSESGTPIWQLLLLQAREQLDRQGYGLSILSSVIAVEAFVDETLINVFDGAGVEKRVSNIIVGQTYGVHKKLSLLSRLARISLRKSNLQNRWEKVDTLRNRIVHGEVAESTESDAHEAFDVAVRSVFHLLVQSLNADATRSAREQRLRCKSASGDLGVESRA